MNPDTTITNHTIAVYSSHFEAENAISKLSESGFDMKHLSIIGLNYQSKEQPVGFINTGDRMWSWGKFGAFWGSIWGLLFGSAMLFVPGLGYVLFAGWIVSALEGAMVGGGFAALAGALSSLGIPNDTVIEYESALKAGSFMVLVRGSEEEVEAAKVALNGLETKTVHSYPGAEGSASAFRWSIPNEELSDTEKPRIEHEEGSEQPTAPIPMIVPGNPSLK